MHIQDEDKFNNIFRNGRGMGQPWNQRLTARVVQGQKTHTMRFWHSLNTTPTMVQAYRIITPIDWVSLNRHMGD